MYTIVLVSSLFFMPGTNQPAKAQTETTFISQDACKLMAAKMTEASGMKHECKLLAQPRSI